MNRGKSEGLRDLYRHAGFKIIHGFSKLLSLRKINSEEKSDNNKQNKTQKTKTSRPSHKLKPSERSEDVTSIVSTIASPRLTIVRKNS